MLLTYAKKSMYNLSAYGFAGISSRLINFLFLPYFLSKLTLSELGIWEWYQSWFSLGVFLLSSCAATGMIRFALLYVDDEQKQRQAIGNAFLLVTLLSCAIACVVYTLLYFDLFLSKDSYSYITLINAILFAFFSLELAYWRMHENLKLYITIFLAQSLISTILTIVWLNFSYGINAFFYAVLFSLIPFFVVFFLIFKNYFVFDWSLAKLQLYYAGPILVHGLLYVLLYNIDRWAIMHSQGFAVLGAYGLLWRFGSIFQTLTIAINDTWPIVCLKAYNEFNNSLLLKKLVIYFSLLLISCYIGVLVISIELFKLSTPFNYHYLVAYLPFLFIFVLLSAFAQLFTIGSVLIRKTNMLPWLTGGTVLLQYVFLNSIASYGIGAICFGNSIVFLLYCVLNGWMGWRLCPAIINVLVLQKITVLFFIFFALLQVTLILQLSFFIRVFILLLWPSAVYYSKLLDDEFSWLSLSIKNFCIQQGVRFFTIKKKKSNSPMQHIFYLRADHCYGQTKIGGSVAHTLGVLKAWVATGIHVTVASSEMHTILSEINDIHFFPLTIWPGFCWLRWRFSYIRWRLECFFSNLFFFLQLKKWLLTTNSFDAIYQRYSLLSFLGLLVARFKKVPLILEYNGSEVWAYRVWSEKCWMRFEWLAEIIEEINLRAAERIIVVSEVIKEELRSLGIEEKKDTSES